MRLNNSSLPVQAILPTPVILSDSEGACDRGGVERSRGCFAAEMQPQGVLTRIMAASSAATLECPESPRLVWHSRSRLFEKSWKTKKQTRLRAMTLGSRRFFPGTLQVRLVATPYYPRVSLGTRLGASDFVAADAGPDKLSGG